MAVRHLDRVPPLRSPWRVRGVGADGAHRAWSLGRLPVAWHAVDPAPGADGDRLGHVLVGPGGVFALVTAELSGKVWVGADGIRHRGRPTGLRRAALAEAEAVARVLGAALGRAIDVAAAVAILADEWTVVATPPDVVVGAPRAVRDRILRAPTTLSAAEIGRIRAALTSP